MDGRDDLWIRLSAFSPHILAYELPLPLRQLKLSHAEGYSKGSGGVESSNESHDMLNEVRICARIFPRQDPPQFVVVLIWRELFRMDVQDLIFLLDKMRYFFNIHLCLSHVS